MHIFISALSRFTQPTGICRHAANLARTLSDLQQITKVTLLVGQWQEEYFRGAFNLPTTKIEILPIAITNNSVSRNRWFAFGLPKLAKTHQPAIVHLGFPVPVFRSRFDCPVVATVHDLYPYDVPKSLGRFNGFCKRIFIRRCMQACDGVTCVSECTRQSLRAHFPRLTSRVPVKVVHNYADFPSNSNLSAPPADTRPFLLTVAQHQPNKRLDLVLQAFAELRSETLTDEDFQLYVVGSDGAHSERLRRYSRDLDVDRWVHWMPPLSDRQLAELYAHCRVFIASSSIEGFCLPLLEAQVFNCRIVASDIPVFHEIAGESPVYFDLRGEVVQNLKEAILHALHAPSRTPCHDIRFSRRSTALECLDLYAHLLPELVSRNSTDAADGVSVRRLHAATE